MKSIISTWAIRWRCCCCIRTGMASGSSWGPDVLGGQHVQFVVPRAVWQGSRLIYGGSFALIGTTMAPGFDLADWAEGKRDPLIREYPEHAELIRALTR